MKLKPKLLDFFLLIIVLAASIFLIISSVKKTGSYIIVTADNKNYEYSLSQNGVYSVEGILGQTSFEIKEGNVRIIDSPCPNKTCVKQGWGKTLVCLPNNVIINVETSGEIDGISQ